MHAGVFSAALKEDVVTVLGPGGCECGVDNGAPVTLTSKFGMGDDVFEKPVPLSGSQEIWRGDEHAGCNDLCVYRGYEDRNPVVGQHLCPNSLGSLDRLRTGAHLCDPIELEQWSKVGDRSKPGMGHLNTELRIALSLIYLRDLGRRDRFDLDHEIRAIQL
jgi:hypothetical protein